MKRSDPTTDWYSKFVVFPYFVDLLLALSRAAFVLLLALVGACRTIAPSVTTAAGKLWMVMVPELRRV